MDINYLLALQNFRDGAGAVLAEFFLKMTFLTESNSVIIILSIVYWSLSKDYGTYLLMGWGANRVVNGLIKVTACIYRPWIRDPRIMPYSDLRDTTTGYSFPSGHSTNAASAFGGLTIRKEMPKVLRILFGIMVLLAAFSRNFLGVHTPQDILVGIVASLLVMWLTLIVVRWVDANLGKDWIIFCIFAVISVLVAVYAGLKSYPEDYIDGKLIVDGAKMAKDTFKGAGYCLGFMAGWMLERRFVKFTTDDVPMMTKIVRSAVGIFGYYIVSLIIAELVKNVIPGSVGALASCFVKLFYVSFCFPWCMKYLDKLAVPGKAANEQAAN